MRCILLRMLWCVGWVYDDSVVYIARNVGVYIGAMWCIYRGNVVYIIWNVGMGGVSV